MKACLYLAGCVFLAGCSAERPGEERAAVKTQPEAGPAKDERPVIVAFGDSLTAGFGVDEGKSYPDFLQQMLDAKGYRYRVVNAGISGDTTSGGVDRLDSVLALKPRIVVLELGANDGLRGLPVASTQANLDRMITELKAGGARVVLAGMTLPRNYGAEYIRSFEKVFTGMAEKHSVPLIPFLLAGVVESGKLMQKDGLHPAVEGNRMVAANVMKAVEPLLER